MAGGDYVYRSKLVRVIDGDTVVLALDMGLRMTATVPIRLLGVDTPERSTLEGKAATVWVEQWMNDHPDLQVATFKNPEKYGRWLGIIFPDGQPNTTLNQALLDAGMGVEYTT